LNTIVFIGSNKSGTSRDALAVSKQMGYYTILLTDRKELIRQRDEFPEVQEMIFFENLFNKEGVSQFLDELKERDQQLRAVISFTDPFVSYAASIAKERGLTDISVPALIKMEEKTCIREQLNELPVTPQYFIVSVKKPFTKLVDDYHSFLPLIVKNPISNGSKDVLMANTREDLKAAFQYFEKKFPGKNVLLEEFVNGTQYVIEVLVCQGRISIAAVIEQEIMNGERFIITGYSYPAQLTSIEKNKLKTAVGEILNQLGLTNGSCHLEMRLTEGEWKLIEINPRMSGGAMNRIIFEGTGINLVKETINLYLGEAPSLKETKSMYVFAKFITINSRGRLMKVTGKNRASAYEGVKEVFIKPRKGAILTKPFSLGDRYAYVLASANTAEQAKKISEEAAKEIKFYLEPL